MSWPEGIQLATLAVAALTLIVTWLGNHTAKRRAMEAGENTSRIRGEVQELRNHVDAVSEAVVGGNKKTGRIEHTAKSTLIEVKAIHEHQQTTAEMRRPKALVRFVRGAYQGTVSIELRVLGETPVIVGGLRAAFDNVEDFQFRKVPASGPVQVNAGYKWRKIGKVLACEPINHHECGSGDMRGQLVIDQGGGASQVILGGDGWDDLISCCKLIEG